MKYHFKGEIRIMDKEEMQDIKERLDLFPSNMNEPSQKAYCELFDYINHLEQRCKKQKEVIDKIYELIKQHIRKDEFLELNEWQTRDLLNLLKEVSE